MLFQIPQFIETEDKIVGPLSLKQFLYVGAAGGLIFGLFFILNKTVWFMVSVLIGSMGASLAFIQYNGQPLPKILWYAVNYFWRPRLYLWRRAEEVKAFNLPSGSAETRRGNMEQFFSGMPSVKKLWQDLSTSKSPLPKREKMTSNIPAAETKERFELFRKTTGERSISRRVDYR